MIEELVKDIVSKTTARYAAEIGRYKDPTVRFNKAVDFLFGPDMINDENFGFFYDCWAQAGRNEKVRESFTMLYRRFREAMINLLVETNKSAGLSPAQVKEIATMVVAIQDGVSIQWDMDRRNVDLKKMSRMTKRLIEIYIEDKKRAKSK